MDTNYSFVHFHVGRGGHFKNGGHKSFIDVKPFHEVISDRNELSIIDSDFNDDTNPPLPDDEWTVQDESGNVLLTGRDEIEANEGEIEVDTIYDTDIVRSVDHCDDEELDLLAQAIMQNDFNVNDLSKDDVDWIGDCSMWVNNTFMQSYVTWNSDPLIAETGETLGAIMVDFWKNRHKEIEVYTLDDEQKAPTDWSCHLNVLDPEDADDKENWDLMLKRLNIESALRIFKTDTMLLCLEEDA